MAGAAEEVTRALLLVAALASGAAAEEALSYGEGGCGRLSGAVALPCSGPNFEAFTRVACLTGRNYLHPLVASTIIDAYASLGEGRRWRYGDLGFKEGGRFKPHRTHQNGASADFFVPLTDDWKATGAHLSALREAGRKHGVGIKRVIIAPEYIAPLLAAAPSIRDLEPVFMKTSAWVRHDEHYHVDFSLPAAATRPLRCK